MTDTPRPMPASPEFKAWFRKEINQLRVPAQAILDVGEEHLPILFIYPRGSDKAIAIAVTEFMDNDDKDIVAGVQKFIASQVGMIEGVIFLVETWAVKSQTAEEIKNYKTGDLSKHPDRVEMLMMSGIRGGMQMIAMFAIDKMTRSLGEPELIDPCDPKGLSFTGRFTLDSGGKLDA